MKKFFSAAVLGFVMVSAASAYTNVLDGGVTNIFKSVWTNAEDITIGSTSSVNRLEVDRSAYISNVNVTVGASADADNNSVLVNDSTWIMDGDLTVGDEGSGNEFEIDGSVVIADEIYVGAEAGANSNSISVTDDDAYLVAETLYIGAEGNTGNVVSVSDGGTVQVTNLEISAGNDFNLEDDGTLRISELDASQDGFNWYDGGSLTVYDELENFDSLSGSNKALRISGADWDVDGDLTVSGYSNSLYIYDGADVTSENVEIGGAGSEGIIVAVSGDGTDWDMSGAFTMDGGVSNSLSITDGADLTSDSVSIGGDGAQETTLYMSDDDTSWEVDGLFSIGDGGSNTLVYIDDGAVLESGTGNIGGENSYSNIVYLTDDGTEWLINDGELTVSGESNRLVVTDGAVVVVGNADSDELSDYGGGILVADSSGASLSVSGTSTVVTDGRLMVGVDDDSTGTVDISDGGTVGAVGVTIEDGSELNLNAGGTLEVYDDFDASTDGFNWNDGGELNVSYGELTGLDEVNYAGDYYALVSGSNKTLVVGYSGYYDNSADMFAVGWEDEGGNSLLITNGGSVEAESLYVGYGSDSNTVLVAGEDSLLDLDSELYVGWSNSVGNTVTISNGASVIAESFTVESNNTVYLGDDGSLTVSGDFSVADADGLVWGEAELVIGGELTWEENLDQDNQTLTLSGDDAVWDRSASDLVIGTDGIGNMFRIEDGASATNSNTIVGQQDSAVSNQVVVTGTDSTWVNTGTLTIGTDNNTSNMVTVSSGALVVADVVEINGDNYFNLNSGGTLEITGSFDASQDGFNWNESGALEISTNAVVYSIGSTDGTNRVLTVDGGTVDDTAGTLIWGRSGYGSDMVVSNGGSVVSADAVIGYNSDADENTITLSGSGTSWTNSGELVVGLNGSENILTIAESSTVYTATAYIGSGTSASDNEVVVTGSNSLLQVDTDLVIGVLGSENVLTVSDNGTVSNTSAVVGLGGDDNEVLVTSTGLWSTVSLLVGAEAVTVSTNVTTAGGVTVITITSNTVVSSGNSVTVEDGGVIEVESLEIVDGNTLDIDDGGTLYVDTSVFNITNEQYEGLSWNSGGTLALTGELLGMDTTNVDVSASSTSNTFGYLSDGRILTLDGSGASWTNENLIVGFDGDGSGLILTNGGWVSQATTYIGWEGTWGNSVLVASNSTLTSTSNLYVGVYHDDDGDLQQAGGSDSLAVSNGGWVFVGSLSTNDFAADESGMVVASTNGAEVIVGNDSSVLIEDSLWIGYSNLTGSVTATNGGSVTTESLYIEDGSVFNIDDGGKLYVTGDYDYDAQTNVVWNEGGELAVGGELTGISGMFTSNRTLSIDGSNAVWNLGTEELVIGSVGDDNSLYILNGGQVTSGDGVVGRDITSDGNLVYVGLSNSLWNVQGTLYIGMETNGSSFSGNNAENYVVVANTGTVKADALQIATNNAFYLNDGGTLEMQGDFDLTDEGNLGLVWNSGGNLAVKGVLSGMPTNTLFNGGSTYLTNGWHLTLLEGGSWDTGTNNLIVGYKSDSALLTITNNASAVVNSNVFVGWGSGAQNNGIFVGDDSSLTIGSNLYVGAYYDEDDEDELIYAGSGNYLIQTNSSWVTLGDFDTTGLSGGVGIGTNRTLVVGKGSLYAYDGLYVDGGTNWVMTNGTVTTAAIELNNNGVFELDGSLNMLGDLDAGMTGFNWNSGGEVYITNGVLSGLDLLDGTGKVLTVEQSWWTNNGFTVTGSNHTISIVNSSKVYSASSVQIGSMESQDTLVQIMNTDTVWTVSGDFTVGASNSLSVTDSGSLLINGSLALYSGSAFTMETSAVVSVQSDMLVSNAVLSGAGTIQFTNINNMLSIMGTNSSISSDLVFDAGGGDDTLFVSDWEFSFSSNTETQFVSFETLYLTNATLSGSGTMDEDNFDNVEIYGGTIAPDGLLYIDTDTISISGQPTLEVTVYGSDSNDVLRVDADLDGVVMDAEITIEDSIDDIDELDVAILIADNGGVDGVFSSTNGASVDFIDHYLLYDFFLTNDTVYEVNVYSELKPGDDISSALTYAGTEAVRTGFSSMKDAVFTRVKQLRRNLVATAHSMTQEAYLMTNTNAPAGAQGPGNNNTIFDMHIWSQYFSGQGEYDAHGNSYGYTLNNSGTTIGADRLLGEDLTLGFNYTYVRSDADTTNSDTLDSETYWIGAYGEWVNKDGIYVDALAAYGRSSFDSVRVEDSYYGTGSYRGNEFGGYVDVGQYLYYNNLALAPYAGLNVLAMQMDGYTEEEENGTTIGVGDSSRTIVESSLGLKGRYRFDTGRGRFQLTGFAEWTHDFVGDQVDSTLKASGIDTVTTSAINPDEDVFGTGLGLSWICTEYMEIGVGYNGRFSDDYEEHSGTLMLDIMF